MKKSFLLLCVLMLAAGCGGTGSDDANIANAPVLNLAGAIPAGVAGAPGRNLALAATNYEAVAVNAETGIALASVALTSNVAGATFTIPVRITTPVKTLIQVRHKTLQTNLMARYLGAVQPPTATTTINNIAVTNATTAKALLIQSLIQTQPANVIVNAPLVPDTTTDLSAVGADQVEAKITQVATVDNTITAALTTLTNTVTTLTTAVTNATDTAAITTAVTTFQTAATSTVTEVTNKVTAIVVPYIEQIKVNGTTVYSAVSGVLATVPTFSKSGLSFNVKYNQPLTGSFPYFCARVTENYAGSTISHDICYSGCSGHTTAPSYSTSYTWADFFNGPYNASNSICFDGSEISFTLKSATPLQLMSGATYTIQVLSASGLKNASGVDIAVPTGVKGSFKLQ